MLISFNFFSELPVKQHLRLKHKWQQLFAQFSFVLFSFLKALGINAPIKAAYKVLLIGFDLIEQDPLAQPTK
jgi:hypothetical protein